jgi:hypothetical protein
MIPPARGSSLLSPELAVDIATAHFQQYRAVRLSREMSLTDRALNIGVDQDGVTKEQITILEPEL